MVDVRSLKPDDVGSYGTFVSDHPAGLLHYGIAYRDLIASHLACEHDYQIAIEDGKVRGVLPVMWRQHSSGKIYNSLPFYGSHGGPLADTPEVEDALWARWEELATGPGTLAATVITNPLKPTANEPGSTLTDERISQITALPASPSADRSTAEDAVLGIIDKGARYDIRKAFRSGVTVESGTPGVGARLQALANLHADNMRALGGAPKSLAFFAAVPRHFTPLDDFDVYLARLDGRVVAALLLFTMGHTVEYFTPALDADYRSEQPLAAILSHAMADAIQRQARRWNWGGTWFSQAGLFRFKRKWGADDRRYRYLVTINDEHLLEMTQPELQDRFSGFYVVPFQALRA